MPARFYGLGRFTVLVYAVFLFTVKKAYRNTSQTACACAGEHSYAMRLYGLDGAADRDVATKIVKRFAFSKKKEYNRRKNGEGK